MDKQTDLIRESVYEALENALQNGFDPLESTVGENVQDLLSYDANLERCYAHEVLPHVEAWMAEERSRRTRP